MQSSIKETIKDLGVCHYCVTRLVDGVSADDTIYSDRSFLNDSLCSICYGMLCNENFIQSFLKTVVSQSEEERYEFEMYQLNISEPLCMSIRERQVWSYLEKNGFSTSGLRKNSLPVKTVFKWVVEDLLNKDLNAVMVTTNKSRELEYLNGKPYALSNAELCESDWYDPMSNLIHIDAEFILNILTKVQQDVFLKLIVCGDQSLSHENKKNAKILMSQAKRPRESSPDDQKEFNDKISRTALEKVLRNMTHQMFWQYFKLDKETFNASNSLTFSNIKLFRPKTLQITGRYAKLSRKHPQSPWFINNVRKGESSVEELICDTMKKSFVFNGADASKLEHVFLASGREDVDVRCLGHGRPFMVELRNCKLMPQSVLKRLGSVSPGGRLINDLSSLAKEINQSADAAIFIRDFQFTSDKLSDRPMRQEDVEKRKQYRAICWCGNGGLTKQLAQSAYSKLNVISGAKSEAEYCMGKSLPPFVVKQMTPIRVLHRRNLAMRERAIYSMFVRPFDELIASGELPPEFNDYNSWLKLYPKEELFILEVSCQSGTYIKELVHGDLGRCTPSLSSLFDCQVDLLALDVTNIELDWPPTIDTAVC